MRLVASCVTAFNGVRKVDSLTDTVALPARLIFNSNSVRSFTMTIVRVKQPYTIAVKYGHSGLWMAETFWLLCNSWTEFNETWQEERLISTSSIKFVIFWPIRKQSLCFLGRSENKWPSWPLIGWDIFDFFSETPEQNSTKLVRKQVRNVLCQVCRSENIDCRLGPDWMRRFRLLLCNRWTL